MSEPIMVACDLHDANMLLLVAEGREEPRQWDVKNNPHDRESMIRRLKRQAAEAGDAAVVFAYEASGLGFGLRDQLEAAGIRCYVLAPSNIARSAKHKRRKTDRKDAERLLEVLRGHVLAGNPLPAVWVPDQALRDDRELVRGRLDVAEKQAALKTQVGCLLKSKEIRFTTKGWTKQRIRLLVEMTTDAQYGFGFRQSLASLLRQLEGVEEEIKRLDEALEQLAGSERYAASVGELTKQKGVGLLTAMVFLVEIGDPHRFNNRQQISAYLGLVPSSNESGKAGDRKGHITRQGPPRVRKVLCQAGWTRIRCDASVKEDYQRLVEKNPKKKKIAVVAMMRKLAVLLWHRACDVPPRWEVASGGQAGRVPPAAACLAPAG